MRASERIEINRQRAKDQRRADRAVEWALVESFGMAGFKAAYERCLQSERFPALCSLAVNTPQHSDTWPQVVAFAKTLANNPRSRSNAYRKAVRSCRHAEVSLATTSDPETVCADCGETLREQAMTTRTPFWQSVNSLRQLETTIIAAGEDGITIADLQAATGLSRRTIDRNLNALRELGSSIYHDDSAGRVARRWMLRADQAVFRWMVRR